MKQLFILLLLLSFFSCIKQASNEIIEPNVIKSHPYFSDTLIQKPVIFWAGNVSTNIDKFNTSFSPNGQTIYYTATSQKLGITAIAQQKFESGRFSAPEFVPLIPFDIPAADVQISPDGNTLLFSTFQDYEGKPEGFNFNIWISTLQNGTWASPTPFGSPIASKGNEFYPVLTENKTLYFNSDREGNSNLYFSRFENGVYQEPIRLPENINSPRKEADAFIARDESYIIFVRVDEPDGFGNSDLYISFKTGENEWTDPQNMGSQVNSDQIDGSPYVTPEGKYLIFTSGRKKADIKQSATTNYAAFKKIHDSSENGSLNFYIMSFDWEKYK